MDLENQNQMAFQDLDFKDMVEYLEKLEITSQSFDSKMACLQYFSYILTWDIVNARFFYYRYQMLLETEQIGKEMTKFLKLVFENKYSELKFGCDKLCELLNTQQAYKKWTNELKNRVQDHLKKVVEKNFKSISAVRLSSFGVNPQGQDYIQIEEKKQENTPIDIEKLTQMARLIQNMENKKKKSIIKRKKKLQQKQLFRNKEDSEAFFSIQSQLRIVQFKRRVQQVQIYQMKISQIWNILFEAQNKKKYLY